MWDLASCVYPFVMYHTPFSQRSHTVHMNRYVISTNTKGLLISRYWPGYVKLYTTLNVHMDLTWSQFNLKISTPSRVSCKWAFNFAQHFRCKYFLLHTAYVLWVLLYHRAMMSLTPSTYLALYFNYILILVIKFPVARIL